MEQKEFLKLLKKVIRTSVDSDTHDLIRVLATKRNTYELAWYGFEEVAYIEFGDRTRWYWQSDFDDSEKEFPIGQMSYALKKPFFDSIAEHVGGGWIVPFTTTQLKILTRLGFDYVDSMGNAAIPLVSLRRELLAAGLRQHFWTYTYELVDGIGFFGEGDAILARCIIDDFVWENHD